MLQSEETFNSNPFRKEEKKTLSEVIIAQIDACAKEFSKEMKKGFEYQQVIEGQRVTLTAPDQRHTAINHTKTLYDLLLYFFDDIIKEKLKELREEINSSQKKNFDTYIQFESDFKSKKQATAMNTFAPTSIGDFSRNINLNELAEHYRTMFQELVLLFKRRNELSGKRMVTYDQK